MLLPQLLNQHGLFKHLSGLEKKNNQKFENLKSEILSRSAAAVLHLLRIEQLNQTCIKEFELFEDQLNIQDDKIVFSSVSLGYLLNEISPLMSSLRLMQNLMIRLISSYEGISLPNSIAGYFKKYKAYKISKNSSTILKSYWSSTGEKLRSYRDLDQHYMVLTDQYFISTIPRKTILLRFPDNPQEKSQEKFSYIEDINGVEFLKTSFDDIHMAFESLAKGYGAQPKQHNTSVSLSQLGDLRPARNRTLSFLFESSLSQKDGKSTLQISGLGADQLPDLRLSFRKYFLDEEGIRKAKGMYGVIS